MVLSEPAIIPLHCVCNVILVGYLALPGFDEVRSSSGVERRAGQREEALGPVELVQRRAAYGGHGELVRRESCGLQWHSVVVVLLRVIRSALQLLQLRLFNQEVRHRRFVDGIVDLPFLGRIPLSSRTEVRTLDVGALVNLVDIQLVVDIAVIRQLAQVILVKAEVLIAGVVPLQEPEPVLNCSPPHPETPTELAVHSFHRLGAAGPQNHDGDILG